MLHSQAGRFVSQGPDCMRSVCPRHPQLSLLLISCTAAYLEYSIVTSKWCKFWSIVLIFQRIWLLGWLLIPFVFESLIVDVLFFSFFLCAGHTLNDSALKSSSRTDFRSNWEEVTRSMIGSDAEPPSVAASVVSGDVMEIAKLMVLLICITLTACGLYRNRCRPWAVRSQASSSPNASTPPPTEAMG